MSIKNKSSFICQQCGYKSPSFLGKCPECGAWNSLVETVEKDEKSSWGKANRRERNEDAKVEKLDSIKTTKAKRVSSGIRELDQVLGGADNAGAVTGVVPGSLILLSGDPGIGKSTITLQMISKIGGLYVTGEESVQQVKLRAERLKVGMEKILILSETNLEAIITSAEKHINEINLLVVDSIQTLWSEELSGTAGSVGQVRESTLKLLDFAKKNNIPVLIIGHITKEGTIAGPKVLEHIVDTVLYLEGERYQSLRLLRTTKNRYGPVDEVGVFSMTEGGMKEVSNPSELFLGSDPKDPKKPSAGSAVIVTLEGSRPILVEVQALTVSSQLAIPRRVGTGINNNRLQMLVAILQKHLRLPLGQFDIFVNVVSGLKVFEPAADLGICLAIISSFKNIPLGTKTAVIGEVGLLGEIRNVLGLERRIKEAKKLGFKEVISSQNYTDLTKAVKDLF
jgi:DNA repair protein RadA/Sms